MIALTDHYSVEWELWVVMDNIATWKARAALEAEATRQRDIARAAERERTAEVAFVTIERDSLKQQRDDLRAGHDAIRAKLGEYEALKGLNTLQAIEKLVTLAGLNVVPFPASDDKKQAS